MSTREVWGVLRLVSERITEKQTAAEARGNWAEVERLNQSRLKSVSLRDKANGLFMTEERFYRKYGEAFDDLVREFAPEYL